MTSNQDVLNPALYRRLLRRFGRVKGHNQGQARIVRPSLLSDEGGFTVVQWGEQYYICCTFCQDKHFKLGVSYIYAQRDVATGRPVTYLAHCHNANCLRDPEHREEWTDRLYADDG